MIIGIAGLIGHGKGTVATILEQHHKFVKLSFADSLKDSVAAVFNWNRLWLEGATTESRIWREQVDEWWSQRLKIPNLTPRIVLQQWGTEVCRRGFHDDIWIASLENKIHGYQNQNYNIVIPDVRFPNEIDMIQNMNGKVWLVKRGQDPQWLREYIDQDIQPIDIHQSEWAWAKSQFDQVILNDGSLDDLKNKIINLV